MKQTRFKTLGVMLSAVLAFGTFIGSAPVRANEDSSFEETMLAGESDESAAEFSKEEAADEHEAKLQEFTLGAYETAQTSSRTTEEVIASAKKSFACEQHRLRDSGTPGITLQSLPNRTPWWRDDRVRVKDTTKLPYANICKLYMVFQDRYGQDQEYIGTGFFISPTEILTCGHCLYDHEENMGLLTRLVIEPGRDINQAYLGTIDSEETFVRVAVPESYIQAANDENAQVDNDFGVIQISKDNASSSYIRLSSAAGQDAKIHLSGYPGVARGDETGLNQYEDWSTKTKVDGPRLESDVTGSGGQSGSPILNAAGDAVALYGYGIHDLASGRPYQWGGGVRFTLDYLNAIDHCFMSEDGMTEENQVESAVYRCYNPNSGEHVYTMNYNEVKYLIKVGWHYEGLAWRNGEGQYAVTPVYRLYNPNAGDHHYTTDKREYNALCRLGWRGEEIMWYAPSTQHAHQMVYRLYNPNAKQAGAHHFTTSKAEYLYLVKLGWKGEGIAFDAR